MIINKCPFILKGAGNRCTYYSILNQEGCSSYSTCPFKQVAEICFAIKNDDLSGSTAIENAQRLFELLEVEN